EPRAQPAHARERSARQFAQRDRTARRRFLDVALRFSRRAPPFSVDELASRAARARPRASALARALSIAAALARALRSASLAARVRGREDALRSAHRSTRADARRARAGPVPGKRASNALADSAVTPRRTGRWRLGHPCRRALSLTKLDSCDED